ncbi:MAG: hypothetical protein AVDCRST_MAG64-4341, partial [uncultured Phycisphaerae bacterium]
DDQRDPREGVDPAAERAGRTAEAHVRPAHAGGHGEAGGPQPTPQDPRRDRPHQDRDAAARDRPAEAAAEAGGVRRV